MDILSCFEIWAENAVAFLENEYGNMLSADEAYSAECSAALLAGAVALLKASANIKKDVELIDADKVLVSLLKTHNAFRKIREAFRNSCKDENSEENLDKLLIRLDHIIKSQECYIAEIPVEETEIISVEEFYKMEK